MSKNILSMRTVILTRQRCAVWPYYTFGVAGQSDESLICPSILM